MNTYIYTGSSSLLTMKDNDILNKEDDQNRNMKGCDCCEACVKEA